MKLCTIIYNYWHILYTNIYNYIKNMFIYIFFSGYIITIIIIIIINNFFLFLQIWLFVKENNVKENNENNELKIKIRVTKS